MPKVEQIDILEMELSQKLPHWLDPQQKNAERTEEIRRRHREAWLAEQRDKRRQERWSAAKARALELLHKDAHHDWMDECVPKLMGYGKDQDVAVAACLNMWREAWEIAHPDGAVDPGPPIPEKARERAQMLLATFDPNQPRDEHGRWSETGGGDDSGGGKVGVKAIGLDAATKTKGEWSKASKLTTVDAVMSAAPAAQDQLVSASNAIAAEVEGSTFHDGKVKKRDRVEEKLGKSGKQPNDLSDVVRGGFEITAPAQSDKIVAALAQRFEIVDEGWQTNGVGYFDRKVLIRFDNGSIGEVQMWAPEIRAASKAGGHAEYERYRVLDPKSSEAQMLELKMLHRYAVARAELPSIWASISGG